MAKLSQKTKRGHIVFCPYIKKNGQIIYPKHAKFFRFWVDNSSSRKAG